MIADHGVGRSTDAPAIVDIARASALNRFANSRYFTWTVGKSVNKPRVLKVMRGRLLVKCFVCGGTLNPTEANCPDCGENNGRPHIRRAQRPEEVAALADRLKRAWDAAVVLGSESALRRFEAEVKKSRAVMVRWWSDLDCLVNQHHPILTYYQLREARQRVPQENYYDDNREAEDSRVNPNYFKSLNYAVVSLDGLGAAKYGRYHLTWNDQMIETRTTVFEENPFRFNKRLPAEDPIARLGHRTTWDRRSDLAVAKLHSRIAPSTDAADFAAILVEQSDADLTDYIEVHIDGPLMVRALRHVIARIPEDRDELRAWNRLKKKLKPLGITWDEIA